MVCLYQQHKKRLIQEPLPRFQRMYGKDWMSSQKPATGVEPSWRTSSGAVQWGNVGVRAPSQSPHWALPCGAMRRGPLSSRPHNGSSTDSLHPAFGKAADTQHQPLKAAGRGAVPCRATGEHVLWALGAQPLHQCGLDLRHGVKRGYFGVLRFNDCPAGLWTCTGPVVSLFCLISPF